MGQRVRNLHEVCGALQCDRIPLVLTRIIRAKVVGVHACLGAKSLGAVGVNIDFREDGTRLVLGFIWLRFPVRGQLCRRQGIAGPTMAVVRVACDEVIVAVQAATIILCSAERDHVLV